MSRSTTPPTAGSGPFSSAQHNYAAVPLSNSLTPNTTPYEGYQYTHTGESSSAPILADGSNRSEPYKPLMWSSSTSERPLAPRRFSMSWWRYKFRVGMAQRGFSRLVYGLSGALLIIIWFAIALAFAFNLRAAEDANRVVNVNNGQTFLAGLNRDVPLLFISGQFSSFDSSTRNLHVDWSAFVVQGPITDLSTISSRRISVESLSGDPIAIYRDTVARPDQELIANGTSTGTPFRLRAPNIKPVGFLGISDYDSISTDIGLGQRQSNIALQPEFGYPLDIFTGNITFVAANNKTIEESGRLGSAVLQMNGAILTDSLLNLKIRTSTYSTCLDEDSPGCELTITFWVERTGLVKFCVVVVFCINWIITIGIFLVTGEALLLNRQKIVEGTDILAICFTALFALPSVRSLLPGVPVSYGCFLDIIGILPNVLIVTLCTTFFANSRLRMRRLKDSEDAAKPKGEAKAA